MDLQHLFMLRNREIRQGTEQTVQQLTALEMMIPAARRPAG
jgi:hypothetical protein